MTPFAVNMAVFLYQAPGSEDVVARLLWNERAVPIPWCGNDIDCDALEFVVSPVACFYRTCFRTQVCVVQYLGSLVRQESLISLTQVESMQGKCRVMHDEYCTMDNPTCRFQMADSMIEL